MNELMPANKPDFFKHSTEHYFKNCCEAKKDAQGPYQWAQEIKKNQKKNNDESSKGEQEKNLNNSDIQKEYIFKKGM